jgi:sortase A
MRNQGKRRRQPLFLIFDILIVLLAASGLYLILKPVYIHWRQDLLTRDLQLAFQQGDGTIVMNPDALEVPGEEIDYAEINENYGTGESTSATSAESSAPGTSAASTADPGTSGTTGTAGTSAVTTQTSRTPTKTPTPTPVAVVIQAIGKISIPVIKVDMPIAEGATKYNLRVAIGHYSYSANLGQPGLCVLFGHRMYTYGRHFNRLGEVKIGDQIIIEDKQNRYTYEVDLIDTILPERLVFELNVQTADSRIMLVTCTPVRVASHRLLVKGKLIQTEPLG